MNIAQELANLGIDVAIRGRDAARQFDLEKEYIGGFFSNLTLLSMLLTSLGGKTIFGKKLFKREYDFVIVGGGTAGSVMAMRLTEDPCISVLLLEAGGEPPLLTEIPSFARLFFGSKIDWFYKSEPQKNCAFGQNENRVILNNGKVLGGSSGINAMLYVRGNKKNYDDWEMMGAKGWSWKDVFPYFLKLEDNRNIAELDRGYHRRGGPQTAERINYVPEIKHPILQATAAMGYEERDINGERQTGVYDLQATVRNQQRCSTAKSYLLPARSRPNLDILTHAFATKILIKNEKGRNIAYGVQFDRFGTLLTQTVYAKREVLVCNGAIRTPQLLMLSGIGPKEHLQKFKIPVIADLPVGKNLQDHYAANLVYTVNKTIIPVVQKLLLPSNILDYIFHRRGPLTSPTQVTLMAFLNGLNTTKYSVDFPRQELYFAEYDVLDARANLNLKDEVYDQVYKPYTLKPIYICYSSLLQPESRGEITLSSTNPHDYPKIDPRYYEKEKDLEDVVTGLKICEAIAKHPAMRKVQAELIETQNTGFPNCQGLEGDTDAYFGCMAKQVINTFWHYSGTARMGDPNDATSVVDPELRVIGVEGLRVINAAVMPIVVSANTNVPTMMIAEKASDIIKQDIENKTCTWSEF